jgi:putative peptidoglycan lipid II flippase
VGTILATLLPAGAVSYLYYADRIVQLPLALFGIAMGTALLPSLSEHIAHKREQEARTELRQGLTWLTWITLPATLALLWLAEPIIHTLFEYGKFTSDDAHATAYVLQAYAIGLIAFCWVRVLSMACYANKDAKTPMRFAAIGVAANIILAIILMQPLGYVGLALATALASFLNVALLWWSIRKQHGAILDKPSIYRMLRALLACIPMVAVLYGLEQQWAFPHEKLWQFVWLGLAVIVGMFTYFLSAYALGERP